MMGLFSKHVNVDFDEVIKSGPFNIRFPKKGSFSQDQEWCEVQFGNEWKKIRFHEYSDIYKIPGLYETIFYRTLRCNSPNRISSLLNEVMIELNVSPDKLRVLDVGAGNGMSGEALQSLGIRKIVGIDLLPEAKAAALRDRPWVYDHYLECDLTKLSEEQRTFFEGYKFNTLCTIAALGFGDIPPMAFYTAFNLISSHGFVAFNIKEDFLKQSTGSSFAKLISKLIEHEIIEIELYKRYQHRLNTQGEALYYVGIIAKKNTDIPIEFIN